MTFDEFKKGFIIKGKICKSTGKDIWLVQEKNGNYNVTGLTEHAILWELDRCFESRKLKDAKNA